MGKLITRKEAAEILGRTERAIEEWITSGVIKTHIVKQRGYIDMDAIMALQDTEEDINHAVSKRKEYLEEVDKDIEELQALLKGKTSAMKAFVKVCIDMLDSTSITSREKEIIKMVCDGCGFDDIADRFFLTRERVRILYEKALKHFTASASSHMKILNERITMQHEMESLKSIIDTQRKLMDSEKIKAIDEDENEWFKVKIIDLNLSVRAINCLKCCNINTLGELVQYRKESFMKKRTVGKKTVTELDELLESLGLKWQNKLEVA